MPDTGRDQLSDPPATPVSSATTLGGDEIDLPAHLLSQIRIAVPGYTLLKEIGRGGQGVVYKAIPNDDNVNVAIKILLNGPFAGDDARQRLQRENVALKSLKHPNIVSVLYSGQTPDGQDYLVMEYIDGRPFNDFIKDTADGSDRARESRFLLTIFKQICNAIAAAHRSGITHRDLSPSNILITPDFEPHILDFGLSRTGFDNFFASATGNMSMTGLFMGKLPYASPEQASASRGKVDVRTDVYALGVILYRILAGGRFPYKTEGDLADVLHEIQNSRPAPLGANSSSSPKTRRWTLRRNPDDRLSQVDPILEAIVMHALEKDPNARYQSAGDLERDIAAYLAGEPTAVRPGGVSQAIGRPTPISAALWIAAAIAIIAAAMVPWRKLIPFHPPAAPAVLTNVATPPAPPPEVAPTPRITFGHPETHGGEWTIEGEDLVQSHLMDKEASIIFGDAAWTNYNLTFKVIVMSTSDENGFKALFHWHDPDNFRALVLGNAGEAGFELGHCSDGHWQHDPGMSRSGTIKFGHPYAVRIEVRGSELRCFLDGAEIFHERDDAFTSGRIGLGTFQSASRFREIRVTSVDGQTLWNGAPPIRG